MFNFGEALTYLFKEKNWAGKFLVIFLLQFIVIIPSGLFTLATHSTTSLNNIYNYGYSPSTSTNSAAGTFALIYLCLIAIIIIPFIIISLWYSYENIQAGIQKRQTKAIWENNLEDTIKKAGKYFLVSFVYGLLILVVFAVIFGILFGAFCLVSTLIAGLINGSHSNTLSNTTGIASLAGVGAISLIFICCGAIAFFIVYALAYLFITPALLRLTATNTLGEAFNFSENWEIAKKYFGGFMALFALVISGAILLGVISGFSRAISETLYMNTPVVGIILMITLDTIYTLLATYLSIFVYPRLMGQLYRYIIKKEPNLLHIKATVED